MSFRASAAATPASGKGTPTHTPALKRTSAVLSPSSDGQRPLLSRPPLQSPSTLLSLRNPDRTEGGGAVDDDARALGMRVWQTNAKYEWEWAQPPPTEDPNDVWNEARKQALQEKATAYCTRCLYSVNWRMLDDSEDEHKFCYGLFVSDDQTQTEARHVIVLQDKDARQLRALTLRRLAVTHSIAAARTVSEQLAEEALAVSSARQSNSTLPTIAEWCRTSQRTDAVSEPVFKRARQSVSGDHDTGPQQGQAVDPRLPQQRPSPPSGDARPSADASDLPLSGAEGGNEGLYGWNDIIGDELVDYNIDPVDEVSDAEDKGDRHKVPAPTEQLESEVSLGARQLLLRSRLRGWTAFKEALELAATQSDPDLYRQGMKMGLNATVEHNLLTGQDDYIAVKSASVSWASRALSPQYSIYDTFFLIRGRKPGKADSYYTDWENMPYPLPAEIPFILFNVNQCIGTVKDELTACTEKLKSAAKLQQQFSVVDDPASTSGPLRGELRRGTVVKAPKDKFFLHAGCSPSGLLLNNRSGAAQALVLAYRLGIAPVYSTEKSVEDWAARHLVRFSTGKAAPLPVDLTACVTQGYFPQLYMLVQKIPMVVDATTLATHSFEYMDAVTGIIDYSKYCSATYGDEDSLTRQLALFLPTIDAYMADPDKRPVFCEAWEEMTRAINDDLARTVRQSMLALPNGTNIPQQTAEIQAVQVRLVIDEFNRQYAEAERKYRKARPTTAHFLVTLDGVPQVKGPVKSSALKATAAAAPDDDAAANKAGPSVHFNASTLSKLDGKKPALPAAVAKQLKQMSSQMAALQKAQSRAMDREKAVLNAVALIHGGTPRGKDLFEKAARGEDISGAARLGQPVSNKWEVEHKPSTELICRFHDGTRSGCRRGNKCPDLHPADAKPRSK